MPSGIEAVRAISCDVGSCGASKSTGNDAETLKNGADVDGMTNGAGIMTSGADGLRNGAGSEIDHVKSKPTSSTSPTNGEFNAHLSGDIPQLI